MDTCIFCRIVAGEIPATIIYEDRETVAFLDIKPNNPGHTLIIPRKHHRNIFDIPDTLLAAMVASAKRLATAIKSAVNADGINLAMNNEPAAGQVIFHAHMHVIPRFASDGFKHWKQKTYKDGEIETVADKIKTELTRM